jgi:hypothetical protein
MDEMRGQAFSSSGFTEQQHGGVSARHLLQPDSHVPERFAAADEVTGFDVATLRKFAGVLTV